MCEHQTDMTLDTHQPRHLEPYSYWTSITRGLGLCNYSTYNSKCNMAKCKSILQKR